MQRSVKHHVAPHCPDFCGCSGSCNRFNAIPQKAGLLHRKTVGRAVEGVAEAGWRNEGHRVKVLTNKPAAGVVSAEMRLFRAVS